jgi:hypothetical protein
VRALSTAVGPHMKQCRTAQQWRATVCQRMLHTNRLQLHIAEVQKRKQTANHHP